MAVLAVERCWLHCSDWTKTGGKTATLTGFLFSDSIGPILHQSLALTAEKP